MFIFTMLHFFFMLKTRIDLFTSFERNSLHEHLRMYIDFQTAHEFICHILVLLHAVLSHTHIYKSKSK